MPPNVREGVLSNLSRTMGFNTYTDGKGRPIQRLLSEEEFANMFADMMYGTATDRAQFFDEWSKEIRIEHHIKIIILLMRDKQPLLYDDKEYLRYDFGVLVLIPKLLVNIRCSKRLYR